GLRLRRDRFYAEAADCWRQLLDLKPGRFGRGAELLASLRAFAVEALAIPHEPRERDLEGAKELTLQLLEESEDWMRPRADATRHRLARLEKKIAKRNDGLFA